MDLEYHNTYTQILVENFDAIIKQNIIFQTQIRILEKKIRENENLIEQITKLQEDNENLQNVLNNKQIELADVSYLKQQITDMDYLIKEKNRIQIALNEYMQKYSKCEQKLAEIKTIYDDSCNTHNIDITKMKQYIQILEDNVPPHKLKKIIRPSEDSSTF